MFRAFYALQTPMTNSEGFPTGAIYGFLGMLIKLMEREPTHMAVAFDCSKPTFRHIRYDGYKQGRRATPDDLIIQMPVLQRILKEMGICVLALEGYEADDILGTVSRFGEEQKASVLLVTGDRDSLQLISPSTHVLLTKKGISDTIEMTEEALKENYGLTPQHMVDLKALMGDSSDNIPGIPGIGEKTALKLLAEFHTLEGVLEAADMIPGKLGEKVRAGRDSAHLSYDLGTILRTVPLQVTEEELRVDASKFANALDSLKKLELKSIIARIPACVDKAKSESEIIRPKTETILNSEQLSKLLSSHSGSTTAAVSLENGFSFAFSGDISYQLSAQTDLFSECIEAADVLNALSSAGMNLLCFGGKKIRHLIDKARGLQPKLSFDAEIADYLLCANKPSETLGELSQKRLGYECSDAAVLFQLEPILNEDIKAMGMEELFSGLELPLLDVLFTMEKEGFCLDLDTLTGLREQFLSRKKEDESRIYELAGEKFNILSPKQLGTVLFEKMGLPAGKKTKTGYSTDSDTLESISDFNPIVPLIMDYRFVSKLEATFITGLIGARDAQGRVHSTFNQCVTATGRISSNDPNLQNIPTRTKEGKEIRRAFIASPGNVLVGGDYSQIELRLLAHLSGDEKLIEAFNSDKDIHTITASEVFHIPPELVTKEQRSAAKAVNFGIIYGISDFGLARNLGIPVKAAAGYIRQYLERYPMIQNYMKRSVDEAKEKGFAQTMFGRRRPVPELASSNFNTRSFGERVAMNMPIQGTAADIIKIAMVNVSRALKENGLKSRLILQIHDELIIDSPIEEKDAVYSLLKDCMEHVVELKVKLTAEVSVARNWADAK